MLKRCTHSSKVSVSGSVITLHTLIQMVRGPGSPKMLHTLGQMVTGSGNSKT